jgi:hypothetical protein
MFKIDHDVPIPNAPRNSRYPWDQMQVGDSFFVPDPDGKNGHLKLLNTMAGCASNQKKKKKTVYTVRSESNGVRIWRVK